MLFNKIKKLFSKNEDLQGGFSIKTDFMEESQSEIKTKEKRSVINEILEWLEVAVVAVVAVVLIFTFVFRIATISGGSMLNTLIGETKTGTVGDKVIISNIFYEAKQGDIVVISRNVDNSVENQYLGNSPIIKRVIAVGGQTVNIDFETGAVTVDGVELQEDYISSPTTTSHDIEFPVYVPEGYIFVLGDNRENSLDSRSSQIGENGLIDERYILGRAIYRVFPFNRIGKIK